MAIILRRDTRYDEAASASLLEQEYEQLLEGNAAALFPGFLFVPFKAQVYSDLGSRKADYALIDRQYRKWWVVEVELAHHPFNGHVLPQVEVLASASYGEREAEYLAGQHSELDGDRLRAMMLGDQPQVLVVVNQPSPTWESELRMLGAVLVSVALFRSQLNDYVLLVDGRLPRVSADVLTRCRRSSLMPRFWEVESPGALPIERSETAAIEYEGRQTSWRRIDSRDTVFLSPEGASDSLGSATTIVELVEIEGGRLEFRPPK